MVDDGQLHPKETPVRVRLYGWGVLLIWTAVLGASLYWNLLRQERILEEVALTSGRVAISKDIAYRRWNASLGGVYVPVTPEVSPNPYLTSPRRDVTTSDGQQLTLINPAYMTRMVHELERRQSGIRGHLTSLELMRPENVPDFWEKRAMEAFRAGGIEEAAELQDIDGMLHLRVMQPLWVEESCLGCHDEQGYKVGDLRGGISASIPMASLSAIEVSQTRFLVLLHLGIWTLGLLGNHLGIRRLSYQLAQRRLLQARVWRQANFDALTDLPNRSLFRDRLERTIATAQRSQESFALFFLDLDRFKEVNDRLGHDAGDKLLRQAAERLTGCLRESDTLARMGGDEFTVILPGITRASTAKKVAEKILLCLREPFVLQGSECQISGSIGGAFYPIDGEDQVELLKKADLALYEAKDGGRDRIRFASTGDEESPTALSPEGSSGGQYLP